jgi:mono/diheme cytochrome c family protein
MREPDEHWCRASAGSDEVLEAEVIWPLSTSVSATLTRTPNRSDHASQSRQPVMPSFAAAYSDTEIAAVANYVTARFGSRPSRTTAEMVASLRSQD